MISELEKYKEKGHFTLTSNGNLEQCCNAPNNKGGVYLVYSQKKEHTELVYIGRSGKIKQDGSMFIRTAGLGGIKDRIVNGQQFGKIPRRISWLDKMKEEGINSLIVYWYITHTYGFFDCPDTIENILIKKYQPRWNYQKK